MTSVDFVTEGLQDLPTEVTTFVGRRADRGRVRELMAEYRLVTLTGLGGIGKTRLALRLATELRRVFPGGVYVVALGALADADAVPDQLAAALGLHGPPARSATTVAVEFLRSRTTLLVLDNCEHVIDVTAVLVDTLLRTCPGVRIIATSREPLRILGEAAYPLASLNVPPPDLSDDMPLRQYEAVQLFLERARAVVPDLMLDEQNRSDVADICRKLEGIPLAIELAAARLNVFSPAELSAQLTERWEILNRGSRAAPYRQSTMAACVEWSFDLCSLAERLLWAKASVFVDGFDSEAALAVCYEDEHEDPVADTLASLVDKSVLLASTVENRNRFRMLGPIRQRGLLELARIGQTEELRRRHKDFYLGLVTQADAEWFSDRQLVWIHRLGLEKGNLRKAFGLCAVEPAYADEGLSAGACLMRFGLMEGRYHQGRQWFDQLLGRPPGHRETRVLALRAAAWWAAMQGDVESATAVLEEAQALATHMGKEAEALISQTAGLVALWLGDTATAEHLLEAAKRGFTALTNQAELAMTRTTLAVVHALIGDIEGTLEDHRACLALTEPVGEIWLRSWSLWAAGFALSTAGDRDAGSELLKQSLQLKRALGDPVGIAVLLETLGQLAVAANPDRAVKLLAAAQSRWEKIDTSMQIFPGLDAPHRAAIAAARARLGEAAFAAAWSQGRSLDWSSAIADALDEQPAALTRERDGTPSGSTILTRRERQIAELIHQGLSNKEIAETLVISTRTAETHVQHILTKLGFTTRTQVAAWVGDQQR